MPQAAGDSAPSESLGDYAAFVLDVFDAGVYELDLITNAFQASPRLNALYGYPPEQPLTLADLRARYHPDDAALIAAVAPTAAASGEPRFQCEFRIVLPDGSIRWLLARGEVRWDATRQPVSVRGAVLDVTERARAETALRRSEGLLRAVQEASIDGFMIFASVRDAAGQIVDFRWLYANPAAERIINQPPGRVIGRRMLEALPGNREAGLFAAYARVVETGTPLKTEISYLHDGLAVYARLVAVKADDGFAVSIIDLTDRRRVEDQLRASEARLQLALDVADVALGQINYLTDTIRLSPEAAALYGFPAAETTLPRVQVHAAFHPDDRAEVMRLIDTATHPAGASAFSCEHRVIWPDGQVRWLNVRKQIFFTADSEAPRPSHAILVVQDITARKRRELNLAFMAELQEVLGQALSVETMMAEIGERLIAYLGVTHCVFAEMVHEHNEAFLLHDQRTPGTVAPMNHTQLSRFLTDDEAQQLTAGYAICIDDALAGERSATAQAAFAQVGVRAVISAPYRGEGERWFVLSVQRAQPYAWQADERELVESVVARVYPRLEQIRAQAALRASEERLRSVFESIDEGFCIAELIFDPQNRPIDYRFLQVNPLFEELTGLRDVVGRTAHELVPDLEDWWIETYGRVALTGEAVRFEHGSVPMGRIFDVYASRVGGPESRRVAIVFNEITERKTVEEQVRIAFAAEQAARRAAEQASERTNRLQALTSALAGALTRDVATQVIIDHGIAATGASIAVVGLLDPLSEYFNLVKWINHRAASVAEQPTVPLEQYAPPAAAVRTGEPIWLPSRAAAEARFPGFGAVMERFGDEAYATLPLRTAERVLGVLVFGYAQPRAFPPEEQSFLTILAQQCAQALERAQLYAELLVSQERLQQLSQRLIQTQEQERRHLARELHDEVGQALTGLRLTLELLDRLPLEERAAQLAEAHHITQDLIAKIRALSLDLRPAMLDDMGLLPALIWQIKRYREQTGITVELRHWGLEQRLSLAVETVAYRVIQEALTNIARHAGVPTAHVSVLATPTRLLVQIRDAGCGFVLGEALARGTSSGLAGMQERVALLGGTLSIETGPGMGTAITADLPLPEENRL